MKVYQPGFTTKIGKKPKAMRETDNIGDRSKMC